MTDAINILTESVAKLREYSGFAIGIEKEKSGTDFFLTIGNTRFLATVKTVLSTGNRAAGYSHSNNPDTSNLPHMIIAGYIPLEIAREYAADGINYLDRAGNCNIRYGELVIKIEGKKRKMPEKTNQSRAFQEAGIRIIFHLLKDAQKIELPYRKLAQLAEVSLGSVASVMGELIDLDFILETKKKRILKNKSLLLDRWVTAYHDVLRPRLTLKRMKFTNPEQYRNWDALDIQFADDVVLWGGEPAASLLTHYLSPEKFTLYTNDSWQGLTHDLKLAPAEDGDIEVLKTFWKEEDKYRVLPIVPPLLIYADLMGSRIGRNIETAKMILENELSTIISPV